MTRLSREYVKLKHSKSNEGISNTFSLNLMASDVRNRLEPEGYVINIKY